MMMSDKIEKAYQKYLLQLEENKKDSYKKYCCKIFNRNEKDKIEINYKTQVKLNS